MILKTGDGTLVHILCKNMDDGHIFSAIEKLD